MQRPRGEVSSRAKTLSKPTNQEQRGTFRELLDCLGKDCAGWLRNLIVEGCYYVGAERQKTITKQQGGVQM